MSNSERTFGHGDPRIPNELTTLHDQAVTRGEAMYHDPHLGLWVQTSAHLAKNGKCCGRCCRHCPFERAQQETAGRPLLRPE